MACLGSVLYDPGTLATASTTSLLAMTALDTTNARITFTAPASGNVLVRIRVPGKGAATRPMILLGVLDGATVKGRQSPIVNRFNMATTTLVQSESAFIVTGLTPGNSFTWDAAYGVESLLASTQLGWGGPNDSTSSNAYGALAYEVWDAGNLLAGTMYDPSVAVTKATTSGAALAAFDTTNLRLAFTVPASGRVLVRLRCVGFGATAGIQQAHLGVLQGASVIGRQASYGIGSGSTNTTDHVIFQSEFVVGGLTPAAGLTWDAAFGVETAQASTQFAYGGPDNTTATDAYGGFAYEIWKA